MDSTPITRCFIAAPLPEPITNMLAVWSSQLAETYKGMRWVGPDRMHLTLAFLGDVPDFQLDPLARIIHEVADRHAPFTLHAQGLGAFPAPTRPRVVWSALAGEGLDALIALRSDLAHTLAAAGFPGPADERFRPHVTLGRARAQRLSSFIDPIAKHARHSTDAFETREIHLIASELEPQGPIYTVLARGILGSEE